MKSFDRGEFLAELYCKGKGVALKEGTCFVEYETLANGREVMIVNWEDENRLHKEIIGGIDIANLLAKYILDLEGKIKPTRN